MEFLTGLYETYITEARILQLIRILVMLAIGLPLLFMIRRSLARYVSGHYNQHYGMLAGKVVFYTGLAILVIMVFNDLGFGLTPLLGAAGVVGIALGFASQTSVSNVISGIFLIAEQSFKVGDVISVNGNVGVVLSIDTLSVKLRMFDNRFLRVPNEAMIKSEFINITRFPIRRVDCNISVAYKEDLNRVRELLFDVAREIPYSLQEPAPLLIFDKYGSSSIDLLFVAWATREDFLKLRNGLNMGIKERFDREGIEIPFPHVSVYAGSASTPLPVELLSDEHMASATRPPKKTSPEDK